MSKFNPAMSIGEVQVKLEAAVEHIGSVWGFLVQIGQCPHRSDWHELGYKPPISSVVYSLQAVNQYLEECRQGMFEFVGDTDGQLCPYDDCAHDLAIESAGWCRCGHCKRPFFARGSDSDIEDYHVRRPKAGEAVPDALLWCRDLGPSWATPDGEE